VLLLASPASLVRAECSGMFCTGVYVDQIYTYSSANGIWIQTSGTETALSCTPDSGILLFIPPASAQLKEIYALLMTAQLVGWRINVRVDGGSNPCNIGYVTLDRQ
jgi:hypothetical protein